MNLLLHYKEREFIFRVGASVFLGFIFSSKEHHYSLSCYSVHLLVYISAIFMIYVSFKFMKVVTKVELSELPGLHKLGRC